MVRKLTYAVALAALLASTAAAQEEHKQERGKKGSSGPFGLPAVATLKEKLALAEEQAGKIEALYKEGAAKEQEIRKNAAGDRQKSREETTAAKNDLVAKVKEVLSDEQDKKFDELAQPPRRKKAGGR